MVYYRKYRPQRIDDLDNEKIRQTLTSLLAAKDIPHAFLFTGPKGLGKTSTARIVAKSVNCIHRKKGSVEPCNECDMCISITNGSNMDVIEIDGASNRGIDEIRDLREKVRLAPVSLKKKVYIIDEVHMLTTEAFNALLKTIEEPPAHVLFIFCTTEPQKVPATIVSRCFHISFTLATENELLRSLKRIVQGESLKIDEEELKEIAQLADGSFRDGAKTLEELVLLHGKEIRKEHFQKTTAGILLQVDNFLQKLSEKNITECLKQIEELSDQGVDMKFFLYQLLSELHKILLTKAGFARDTKSRALHEDISLEEIKSLVELFSKAYAEMKYAILPQLPLEIAIIQWCTHEQFIDEKINSFSQKEEKTKPTVSFHKQKDTSETNDEKKSLLENLISKTKSYNHSVAAVLRSCKITLFDKERLVLETAYKFHKERLEEKKTQEVLGKAIKEITGNTIPFQVILKGK